METRQTQSPILRLTWLICLVLISVNACDIGFPNDTPREPPPEKTYATEILGIEFSPNPLVSGDSATFKAVIKDSLKTGFTYSWGMSNVAINDTINPVKVLVDLPPGSYRFSLRITYPQTYSSLKYFDIIIVP